MKQAKPAPLAQARRFFNRKNFPQVIRILEPEIYNYRDNFVFFYLLGLAYVFSDKPEEGESYLKRAHQIDRDDLTILEGLAYAYFKREQYSEAVKIYLEILELDPGNRRAKKGLELIRKSINPEKDPRKWNPAGLLPALRIPVNLGRMVSTVLLIILIPLAAFLAWKYILQPWSEEKPAEPRPGLDRLVLPGQAPALIGGTAEALYTLTEAEVKASFELAKKYFNQYRDNLALVEVNRLLHSNAAPAVKNVARLLKDYVETPDFSTLRDSFPFTEVASNPLLYAGCYVRWAGKINGLEVTEQSIRFNLWVGDAHHFEGVVEVSLDFSALLHDGEEFEVLGRVQVTDSLRLEGIMLHKLLVPGAGDVRS